MRKVDNKYFDRFTNQFITVMQSIERFEIDDALELKWQTILNFLNQTTDIETVLIRDVREQHMGILLRNDGKSNPYVRGSVTSLRMGTLAEASIIQNRTVYMEDARSSSEWKLSPELGNNMNTALISPLHWPDGEVFGCLSFMSARPFKDLKFAKGVLETAVGTIEADLAAFESKKAEKNLGLQRPRIAFSEYVQLNKNEDLCSLSNLAMYFLADVETGLIAEYYSLVDGRDPTGMSIKHVIDSYETSVSQRERREGFKEFFDIEHLKNIANNREKVTTYYDMGNLGKTFHYEISLHGVVDELTGKGYVLVYVVDQTKDLDGMELLRRIVEKEVMMGVRVDSSTQQVRLFVHSDAVNMLPEGFSNISAAAFDALENSMFSGNGLFKALGVNSTFELSELAKGGEPISVNFSVDENVFGDDVLRGRVFADPVQDNIYYLLVDAVGEAVKAEREALLAAQEATEAKSQFLGRVSHDLRTPMNGIIGMSQFGMDEEHDNKMQKYFEAINYSGLHMLDLLDEILDIQKIELGATSTEASLVDMAEFVHGIEIMVVPIANNKNVALEICGIHEGMESTHAYFDSIALKKIILNLIFNAIKYTPSGGHVRWEIHQTDKNSYVHVISDNGIGMSSEYISHMYDPFSREKNSLTDTVKGSGLGLSIVKDLVDLHDATIECESEPDVGTEFTVRFPVTPATPLQVKKHSETLAVGLEELKLGGKSALVCEDNDINMAVVLHMIEKAGMKSDRATNGLEAVKKAKNGGYDIILMDIRMPLMDGLEATKAIRLFDPKTPIVALSANVHDSDIAASFSAGMNRHIAKPVDRRELLEAMTKLV